MPIPQSRLIDLLSAALDYKHSFDALSTILRDIANEPDDSLLRSRIRATARYSISDFLREPIKTSTTIAVETERIQHTRTYNDARRAKARLAKAVVPSLFSPEDEALAQEAGFSSFSKWQKHLFSSQSDENK